ncbi:MAG TPA: T9SS type A sorting domain-containing protein, partial [Chitinophagales bacterium]|nr:T9SS type A sorting domain-containing protein [Chitinophagales bacterium]
QYYNDYSSTDTAYVEVSTNGSSWATVATYTDDQGSLTNFASASIDLNSYVGISNFAIRFRYTNNNDWYWLIDDITISGNISPAVTYSWSPSTGLSATNIANPVASPTSTQTYTLTTSHNGCSVTTDDVIVTVRPDVSAAVANFTLAQCTDPNNPYAVLSATAPTVGSGTWSIVSGSGTLASTTANPTTITGLSTTGTSTQVKWEVAYASAPTCPKSQTLTITPTSLANIGQVSLQSTGSPQYYNCRTCSVKDGNTYTYYDNVGKIIAKVVDPAGSGIEMGNTEVCSGYDYNANSVTPTSTNVKTVLTNYGDQQPYLPRYWSINPVTKTGQDVTVTLYFTQAEFDALQAKATGTAYQFSTMADLVVTKFDNGSGGTFTAPPNYPATNSSAKLIFPTITRYPDLSTGPDYAATFTVSSFSTFYIHPNRFPFAPLPVELVSFTGYNEGPVNKLQWITASELNTDRFEVEKSLDNSSWSLIGSKEAAGNSNQSLNYDFTDNEPIVGNNYYRLKILDNDGTFKFSNIINIPISEAVINGFSRIYPNPTGGQLNVELQATTAYETKITTYDVVGKKVQEKNISLVKGLNSLLFDFSDLAKGTYLLQFTDSKGKTHINKFVKD